MSEVSSKRYSSAAAPRTPWDARGLGRRVLPDLIRLIKKKNKKNNKASSTRLRFGQGDVMTYVDSDSFTLFRNYEEGFEFRITRLGVLLIKVMA